MPEELDIRTLYQEALASVCKILSGVELDPEEIMRLGMFFGTISRYLSVLEEAMKNDA